MAENKTTPNDQSVEAFLNNVDDKKKWQDSFAIQELMQEVTGQEPTTTNTPVAVREMRSELILRLASKT